MEIGHSSPMSFYHDAKFDEEKKEHIIDLSRKIIIFLDQPHNDLLTRLRPLLSHDKKAIKIKIADRSKNASLRTKNITMIGFPSVVFCTASSNVDEQESTRFFLLSPEINQEKIRQAISQKIDKESNRAKFMAWLDELPERKLLQQRIAAIKQEAITDIKIIDPKKSRSDSFSETKC